MPRTLPVRSVMTTDVVTFAADEPIGEATKKMIDHDIDGGPVVDADGHVIGMLTTDELLVQETRLHYPTVVSLFGAYLELPSSHRRFEEELRRAVGATVGEVMQDDVVTCSPDDTLERAATVMHERGVSRLPVTLDGKLVGIIGRGDIIRAIVDTP
jgi:CBS domain-containing protein